MKKIHLSTHQHCELVDISSQIQDFLRETRAANGILTVFSPHTTAAITINENADPDVKYDMLRALDRIVPHEGNYRHVEGNSDAHIKATLVGASETVIIDNGIPQMGTWQAVFFAEFDGPRTREVWLTFTPA